MGGGGGDGERRVSPCMYVNNGLNYTLRCTHVIWSGRYFQTVLCCLVQREVCNLTILMIMMSEILRHLRTALFIADCAGAAA